MKERVTQSGFVVRTFKSLPVCKRKYKKGTAQLSIKPLEQCCGSGMIYSGSGSYFQWHSAFGFDPAPDPA
jgi:hypothetical protein